MSFYLAVVGSRDNPLYEAEFGPISKPDSKKDDQKHLHQFIVHSSLDIVEELMWGTNGMYLKTFDRFNEWHLSAFVTASGLKLMLLHDTQNSEGIRNFFQDTHELLIKVLLNPFTEINAPITSSTFDTKVRALAKRYL
ncbi:Trafficking protein particle complex subunit 2B [Blyttiomyces sp. JEL0837]|nr:Trafficking protein particle complex subunit 2B [Blyttiomyces sp. JEL0837]